MDKTHESEHPAGHRGLILLLSAAAGFLAFFSGVVSMDIARKLQPGFNLLVIIVRGSQAAAALILGSAAAALAFGKNTRLRPYWRLAFSYFVAACTFILSDYAGKWGLALSGQPVFTAGGFTALKLGEDAAIIGVIIAAALLTRDDLKELFLTKGRLGIGLIIGIASFLVLTALGLSLTLDKGVQPDRLLGLLPVFLLVALADGFMEELLFRGLFLKRLGRFVGDCWANLVTAVVFTFMHLDVQFTASLPLFLAIVFLLGLLWGWIMQRTGSLLAPALFHAGVDMLIMADAFASFGIR